MFVCLNQTEILYIGSNIWSSVRFNCAIQLNDIHIININITWSFNTLPPGSIRVCLIRLEVLYERSCSTKGAAQGATCNGISTGGCGLLAQEMKNHINVLELLAIKLAIQTFSKTLKHKAIHLQVDNMVALTYLLKMGGTQNLKLVQLTKEIWDHLLQCGITLTAEYLPSKLNVTADWESRNSSDFSEWKLSPSFQRICQLGRTPEIDLFAFRLSHQIKTYFSWRPDPLSQAADAFQQHWFHKSLYALPPFCTIPKVLSKVWKEKVPMMILVTPAWASQLW